MARGLVIAVTALCLTGLVPDPALASDATQLFGANSPLTRIVDFVTGPFATTVVIIAVFVLGAMLIMGADFSGFGRRVVLVAVAGAFVIFAKTVVTAVYGDRGFDAPPEWNLVIPAPEGGLQMARSGAGMGIGNQSGSPQ